MFHRLPALFLLTAALGMMPGVENDGAPTWPKPDLFWYRKAVEGGHLWLKVDAEHGVKEPLFDHQRLAIELTIRTGIEYTPLTLPFADPAARFVVKYDGSNAYIQEGAMAVELQDAGRRPARQGSACSGAIRRIRVSRVYDMRQPIVRPCALLNASTSFSSDS